MSERHALLLIPLFAVEAPALADPPVLGMMNVAMPMTGAMTVPCGTGITVQIEASTGRIVIRHKRLERLGMPAMTTAFKVRDRALLTGLSVGEWVEFGVMPSNEGLIVTALAASK